MTLPEPLGTCDIYPVQKHPKCDYNWKPIAPPSAKDKVLGEKWKYGWISVEQELPPLDADNCCMEDDERGVYSNPVLVFDEDNDEVMRANYDGRDKKWKDSTDGCVLYSVTHWQPLPAPPESEASK